MQPTIRPLSQLLLRKRIVLEKRGISMQRSLGAIRLAAISASLCSTVAYAQGDAAASLMSLDVGSLKGEIGNRYDAALALTRDASIVSADNSRFMWASQAKAQCGIALGFLKSGTKDPVSIGKCVDAHLRMQEVPAPPPVVIAPPPVVRPAACDQPIAGIVFFDWDSAAPPAEASQTIDAAVQYLSTCNWTGLVVTGHTDRSGSDAYNDALSVRRAQAVSGMLAAKGVASSLLTVTGRGESEPKVPTSDGERTPQNRRVEIMVK
jgi:OOP family OmpA-OmpF porin